MGLGVHLTFMSLVADLLVSEGQSIELSSIATPLIQLLCFYSTDVLDLVYQFPARMMTSIYKGLDAPDRPFNCPAYFLILGLLMNVRL